MGESGGRSELALFNCGGARRQSWGDAMVARSAHEIPSYQHLINVATHDDFHQHSHEPTLYYDLQPISQSYCSSSVFLGSGQMVSSDMAMEVPQVDSTREHPPNKRKAASSYNDGLTTRCYSNEGDAKWVKRGMGNIITMGMGNAESDGSDDDTGIDSKSLKSEGHKKHSESYYGPCSPGSSRLSSSSRQNHSEIEKRRRDKMNTYITELSAMVPMCYAMSRKLDKLTVLRMAVQHMKTIRGAVHSYTDGNYKPSFLSDIQFKHLIKQAAEGFLFVVGCDRGRILYVSESVNQALNYTQADLLGQSWFDILHPKDVAKVKEQLSSSHLSPRERFIDAKTMLPVKTELPHHGSRMSPGARRSFFCRMKCKTIGSPVKEGVETNLMQRKKNQPTDKKYREIHCTGYLKPWSKMGFEEDKETDSESDPCNLSCLVAMGRVITIPLPHYIPLKTQKPLNIRPLMFVSRHAMDGKFLYVDQRATLALGFLPQELLGSSMYEYYHKDDINHLADTHKLALQNKEPVTTEIYRFRSKDGVYVHLQSEWKSFRNPWTKEGEHMIAKNSRVTVEIKLQDEITTTNIDTCQPKNYDFYKNSPTNGDVNGRDNISQYITSHVEASNIGRKIADEVLDEQLRSLESSSNTSTPSPVHQQNTTEIQSSNTNSPNNLQNNNLLKPTQKVGCDDNFSVIRNNVTLSSIGSEGEGDEMMEMIGGAVSQQAAPTDGNDEAAMAVIMSLLEADAGLGGPVDFNGLPWPLP